MHCTNFRIRGQQRDVVYLGLTNSALVYEPKCGARGGGVRGLILCTAVHRSPNKLWRSNYIFNLCLEKLVRQS
jgi:hypothetical protein